LFRRGGCAAPTGPRFTQPRATPWDFGKCDAVTAQRANGSPRGNGWPVGPVRGSRPSFPRALPWAGRTAGPSAHQTPPEPGTKTVSRSSPLLAKKAKFLAGQAGPGLRKSDRTGKGGVIRFSFHRNATAGPVPAERWLATTGSTACVRHRRPRAGGAMVGHYARAALLPVHLFHARAGPVPVERCGFAPVLG